MVMYFNNLEQFNTWCECNTGCIDEVLTAYSKSNYREYEVEFLHDFEYITIKCIVG